MFVAAFILFYFSCVSSFTVLYNLHTKTLFKQITLSSGFSTAN